MVDGLVQRITGDVLVNTVTSGYQSHQAIAALGAFGFVVTWASPSTEAGDDVYTDIKAQLFDTSGNKVGGEVRVNTDASGEQATPSIAQLTDGGFVIVWTDWSDTLGDDPGWRVAAQLFNAAGEKQGEAFQVNTVTHDDQVSPVVIGLGNGGFAVIWEDWSRSPEDPDGAGIKAQIFDAGGTRLGSEFLVNTQTHLDQQTPAAAALSSGDFVVVWIDRAGAFGDGSQPSLAARIIRGDGIGVGPEFVVEADSFGGASPPSVTALKGGGFVIVWDGQEGVTARIYDGDGNALGAEILVAATAGGWDENASVTALSDGGFAVSWLQTTETGHDIRVRVFSADGSRSGDDVTVYTGTTENYQYPKLTALDSSRLVISVVSDHGGMADEDVSTDITAAILSSSLHRYEFAYTGAESSRAAPLVITGFDPASGDHFARGSGAGALLLWGGVHGAAYAALDTDIALGTIPPPGGGPATSTAFFIPHDSLGGWLVIDENGDGTLQSHEFAVRIESAVTGEDIQASHGNAIISRWGDSADNVFFLTGRAGEAVLGLDGNDVFYGSDGVDTMAGGAGNDQYVIRDQRSQIIEMAENGYDVAWFATSDATIGPNIEEGRLFGTASVLRGSDTAEHLVANAGNFSTLYGNGGDDTLWGGGFGGVLHGGAGDDIFRDQGGAFAMYGEEGNDQFVIYNLGSTVTEYADDGIDTVWLAVNGYTLSANIEIARLSAGGAVLLHGSDTGENLVANQAEASTLHGNGGNDVLWGSIFADTLYGGDGDDIMRGQGGADVMAGGTGNDQYVVYSSAAIVTENPDEGYDIVYAGGAGTLVLGQNIEEGRLFDQGTGLVGGNGAELLVGNNAGLASSIRGNGGDDTIWGTAAGDTLSGGAGSDTIYALGGADTILFDVLEWGNDLVAGFSQAAGAKLRFTSETGVTALDQLNLAFGGGNTVVSTAHGSATFFGVTLTGTDFIFG